MGKRKIPLSEYDFIADQYATGDYTFQQLGDLYGTSREAIRVIILKHRPVAIDEAKRNRLHERALKENESYSWKVCPCGKKFVANQQIEYCSREHFRMADRTRLVWNEELWETHRQAAANWSEEHGVGSRTWVENVKNGTVSNYRRTVQKGSLVHQTLLQMIEEDWPLVEEFHTDIKELLTGDDMTMRPPDYIDIVFDGPPDPEPGRFVEVEDSQGRSISFGEWVHRDDGYWVLRLPDPRPVLDRWMDRTSDE